MKIRAADKFDLPEIIEMLRHYRSATPWARLADCDNEKHVTNMLTHLIAGAGIILLAEWDKPAGMLIAVKNYNVWDPELMMVNELAYWVEPDYRGSTAGYRLLNEYVKRCEAMKSRGEIEGYTISKMVNSPDLNYGKFGFEKLEETWRR